MSSKHQQSHDISSFQLHGVGKQIAKYLARLNIYSVQDVLFHLPSRYQNRTRIQSIRELKPGDMAVVEGTLTLLSTPTRGRTKLLCELKDETAKLHLRFFHVLSFQKKAFKVGTVLRCYGEVRWSVKGLEMIHPEFQVITPHQPIPIDQYLTSFYPATEGLSQYTLRKLTTNALKQMQSDTAFNELIPPSLLNALSFPSLKEALQFVHRPPSETSISELLENKTPAQKRLIFEELLAHRLSLLHLKQDFQLRKSVALLKETKLVELFSQQLSFGLTAAQKRVVQEIRQDLQKPHPMLRLVQGDVGSGKTVVAAFAMLQAVENTYQAAMMAPTDLLAEQHYRVFQKWFSPLGIQVVFLSGNVKGRIRAEVLQAIASGEAQIILGTHALFQQAVQFAKLALVVIDEQHRFGVHQRALFREKGLQAEDYPHQLIMTATPIPRTLAMSFYADLDCSIIDELPPGRTPIVTSVMVNSKRDEVIARIREACYQGRQAYWVCPLIEESDVISSEAATKTAQLLQDSLKELKIGLIHGRMKAQDKEVVMHAFQRGEIHVLVATTVIEVGVDVANASLMIIENAERLGLSQLHQLRGRVGRGAVASYCVLLYQLPLSPLAKERLTVMRETTDGFKIAQRDLTLRGPGEVLGTRQTGDFSFRVADLIRDSELLTAVQQVADQISQAHPEYIEPLIKRWVGAGHEYGKV